MKYYIIAGEASGDLHASNLIEALKSLDPAAEFRGWGGDLMAGQGCRLVRHYRDLAFMGFAEVVANLGTILRNLSFCKEDITSFSPDVLVLVDYPGFNLRIAEFAHAKGIRTVYYISPQVWAWKESRVKMIKQSVDRMLVILPFEEEFYRKHGYVSYFVGHPLLDAVERYHLTSESSSSLKSTDGQRIIALLPGSRKQEIRTMLPVMISMVPRFPEFRFVVAAAPSQDLSFYQEIMGSSAVEIVQGNTYGLLRRSHAALVTSGTATLEAALFGVPEVVCYKANPFSYRIAKALVKIDFISLVNLIMGREVVKELIQDEFNSERLEHELRRIISGPGRTAMIEELSLLKQKLGGPGASLKAAQLVHDFVGTDL